MQTFAIEPYRASDVGGHSGRKPSRHRSGTALTPAESAYLSRVFGPSLEPPVPAPVMVPVQGPVKTHVVGASGRSKVLAKVWRFANERHDVCVAASAPLGFTFGVARSRSEEWAHLGAADR
jgi:hypothetical protein